MSTTTQTTFNWNTGRIEKLRVKAERACRVPNIFTTHDATRMCAPRGEAAQEAFERDLSMEFNGDDEYGDE
jgi:hypothetical protein